MKKKPVRPEWLCPRCAQLNEPDDRWCHFCKLDRESVPKLYVELAAG